MALINFTLLIYSSIIVKGSLQRKNDLVSNHILGIAKKGDMLNFAVTCFVLLL